MLETQEATPTLFEKIKPYWPALFFLGGFFLDLLTLGRVDDSFQLIQHAVYFLLLVAFMITDELNPDLEAQLSGLVQKAWSLRSEAIHFLLGSLLSAYMIMYFQSASVWVSWSFLLVILILLVLNEWPRFQKLGMGLRWGLLSICSITYLLILSSLVVRRIGWVPLILAISISLAMYALLLSWMKRRVDEPEKLLMPSVVSTVVHVLFLFFFVLGILPPLPLSLKKIGIYHSVQRVGANYQLSYERPWWRFWQNGAQSFRAEPGDAVVCFVSVFAPSFFKESLRLVWWRKERGQWRRMDEVPLNITGGRGAGYRGYAIKQNYSAGEWQVQVVTSDGRPVGSIDLDIYKVSQANPDRYFRTDVF